MLKIVINPTAGNGRAAKVGEQVLETLRARNIPHTSAYTEYIGHATQIARAATGEGVDTVVAVGGDGTLLEVVRGLHGTETALGIIPAGTGNDVIKMLGLPKTPMEALDFLLSQPARPLDAGMINEALFLNVCGTGFDVVVLDNALSAKKYVSGMLPYLWGVIRTIFTYKAVEVTVCIDDEPAFTKPVLLVAIANGRFIGGGMEVAPAARPDDGLFDIVLIDNMKRRQMPVQLIKLLTGKIRDIPGTSYRTCKSVTLSAKGMRMNIDGEVLPMSSASLSILPDALRAHW